MISQAMQLFRVRVNAKVLIGGVLSGLRLSSESYSDLVSRV